MRDWRNSLGRLVQTFQSHQRARRPRQSGVARGAIVIARLMLSVWLMLFGVAAFAQLPIYTQVQPISGKPVPVVTAQSCTATMPVAVNAPICTFSASNTPTSWAIGSIVPKCTNCFALDNSGNLTGGSGASSVTFGAYTVRVLAGNAGGSSAPQAQTV